MLRVSIGGRQLKTTFGLCAVRLDQSARLIHFLTAFTLQDCQKMALMTLALRSITQLER